MEDRREDGAGGAGWMAVPAFGDWDQKNGGVPHYSVDFSKIREMCKQNKKDISRISVGNDDELINPTATQSDSAAGHNIVGRGRTAGGHMDGGIGDCPHHRRTSSTSPTACFMQLMTCRISSSYSPFF